MPEMLTGFARLVVVPSPSSPSPFQPHALSALEASHANPLDPPASTRVIEDRLPVCTGTLRGEVVVPSPASLSWLWPHAHTVPSVFVAWEWVSAAPIACTEVPSVDTWTGVVRFVVLLSPICPLTFHPQALTVPSLLSAMA